MRQFLALALLACAPAVRAQVYEPARGSTERAAVLDALRDAVRSPEGGGIRGAVEFTDVRLRAAGPWAFINALPQRPGGGDTRHCEAGPDSDGYGDPQVIALLYRRGSRWETWEIGTCATDVGYMGWATRYGTPAGLDQYLLAGPPVPRNARVAQTDDGFVSLRSSPSASSGQRLARMPGGAAVRVLACETAPARVGDVRGRWCQVRYGQQTGYAFGPYLD